MPGPWNASLDWEERRRRLGSVVLELLLQQPSGFKEYDLARHLGERGFLPWNAGGLQDPLALFQAHFLLFHTLYHLRDRVRAEGRFDLSIHCLAIALSAPRSRESAGIEAWDPVEAYYRDADNLVATDRTRVEEMLDWFWRAYDHRERRQEALAVLELPLEATSGQIRRRFRELALRHHPDRGGEAAAFRRVARAMEILRELPLPGEGPVTPRPAT